MTTRTPQMTVADTAPVGPLVGDLWWNSANGIEYVWYDDGDSSQWVATNPYVHTTGPSTAIEVGVTQILNGIAGNLLAVGVSGSLALAATVGTGDIVRNNGATLVNPIISTIINTGTLTLPTTTDTLVGRNTIDTLTNKSISGASNTLTNIPNSALTYSSVSINGTSVSLGGAITVTAAASGVTAGVTTVSGATTKDVLFNNAGVLDSYTPINEVTYQDVTSIYMGVPAVLATFGLNAQAVTGGTGVNTDIATYVKNPYTTEALWAGSPLGYAVIDDNYRAFDYTNNFALISRNPLRLDPVDNVENRVDLGPQVFLQRIVPNIQNNSYLASLHWQMSGSNMTATLGTDPFATASGTRDVQVTMTNHQIQAGAYVWFATSVSGGGVTFGGSSDDNSDYGNTHGSYKVQQVLDANRFTIKVADTASSSVNFGGSGKTMLYRAFGTESTDPFELQAGSHIVYVTHANHQLQAGNYVFWSGGSTIGGTGIKMAGNHFVRTIIDANTYTVWLDEIQDGAASSPANITGGGTPSYWHGGSSVDMNAIVMVGQVISGERANPQFQLNLGLGSPPNYGDGNHQQWHWTTTGYYYTGRSNPTDGGIDVYSLKSDTLAVGGARYTSGPITATGSISGTTLTLTGVSQTNVGVGMSVVGTGIATGTKIVMFLSGVSGGDGTYQVNTSQTVSSTTVTIQGYAEATVVGRLAVTTNPVAGAYYDTADVNVFNDTSSGAQLILRGNYGAGPITSAYLQYSNDVGDQERVDALNNSLQSFGPGLRGAYTAVNYGAYALMTGYQAPNTPKVWLYLSGIIDGADEGKIGIGLNNTSPISPLTILGAAGGLNSNWALSQLTIWGTDTNQRLAIGYDTTNEQGVIQAGKNGDGYKLLNLNPLGGGIQFGVATGTTLALGGATIGSNVLAMTGTTALFKATNDASNLTFSMYRSSADYGLVFTQAGTTGHSNINAVGSGAQLLLQSAGSTAITLNGTKATFGGTINFASTDISAVAGTGSMTLGLGDERASTSVTCVPASGSFTTVTATARYKVANKICHMNVQVTATNIGTATGAYYYFDMPGGILAKSNFSGSGGDNNTGYPLFPSGRANSARIYVSRADFATFPAASGTTQWLEFSFEVA